ncbi:MAG: hypothetical protein LAP87_28655 [Acidobacteriia bacterium]|nr:hypothetical protein [Terriglobia bacterium]
MLCLLAFAGFAQVVPVTVRVSSETVPPGGMAQMKVLFTSPQPIIRGGMALDLSNAAFGAIDGIALFSDIGDVAGAAVIDGGQLNLHFTSPKGTFGTNADYPLMTVTFTPRPGLPMGATFPISLDPAASFWQDLFGSSIPVELKPGSITVGGSISITNVVPGGGTLPAGGTFSIQGIGFSPDTKVKLKTEVPTDIRYVSPTEIQVTAGGAMTLDGLQIDVKNKDGSADTYYSYLRGIPMGQTVQPLLARTVPVFSTSTLADAVLPSTISPQLNANFFTAVALQNPHSTAVEVSVEEHAANGRVIASASLTLPPGARISREVSELLGHTLGIGAYLRVIAGQPIQMVGLLGDGRAGTVLPITFVLPTAPPPPGGPKKRRETVYLGG